MKLQAKSYKYIIGIDEAGRGPLAGPVAVGAVCAPIRQYENKTIRKLFKGVRDSKKMTAKKREEIFEKIQNAQKGKVLQYTVVLQSAKVIDRKRISWAIKNCIKICLQKILKDVQVEPKDILVLLDGGIKAPSEFIHQRTIIRGDDKELVISLASITAKVTRDAHMCALAKKYPRYNLDIHKGYGTLAHRTAIKKYGPSIIHRKTFLRNIEYLK